MLTLNSWYFLHGNLKGGAVFRCFINRTSGAPDYVSISLHLALIYLFLNKKFTFMLYTIFYTFIRMFFFHYYYHRDVFMYVTVITAYTRVFYIPLRYIILSFSVRPR